MMRFGVLGTLTVLVDGAPVPLSRPLERRLLAVLLVDMNRSVSVDRLVEALWPEDQPRHPERALQTSVYRLRSILRSRGEGSIVQRTPTGYSLDVDPEWVDATRFERLLTEAEEVRSPARVDLLVAALDLWRGASAYEEFLYEDFAAAEVGRLAELRAGAHERLLEAKLAAGLLDDVIADAEVLLKSQPLREPIYGYLMLALYRVGRQADALRAFQKARSALAEELGIEPGPALVALEEQILMQDAALTAADDPRPPNNIPSRFGPVIGRDDDIAAVAAAMRQERLLTLTGPAGVGKSTVLIEAARAVAGDVPDGVWIVDVAECEDLTDLVADVCATFHHPGDASPETLLDRLSTFVAPREIQLILDNAEMLQEAVLTVVDRLLHAGSSLRVALGSRSSIGHPAERLLTLGPLEPPRTGVVGLAASDAMAAYPALSLFVGRAQALRADFELTDENLDLAARIVTRLDGLPLAIELAAGNIRTLGLADILEQLDDRFELLRTTSPLASHGSLEAAIESSYVLARPEDQRLFRIVSQVIGPFTITDAARMAEAAEPVVAAQLNRLGDASLVDSDITASPTTRFHMLQSLAEYGRLRAAAAGELATNERRHAECFLWLSKRVRAGIGAGPRQAIWLNRAHLGLADFMAARRTFLAAGDVAAAQQTIGNIAAYFTLRHRHGVAFTELTRVLDAGGDNVYPATAGLHLTLARLHAADAVPRARYRATRAVVAEHLEKAIQARPEPITQARAAMWAGYADWHLGEPESASPHWNAAAASFRRLGAGGEEAIARGAAAMGAAWAGDLDTAEHEAECAEALVGAADDEIGRARVLQVVGGIARRVGDHERAMRCYREGYRLARRFDIPMWGAICAAGEALSAWQMGSRERACERAGAAQRAAAVQPAREGLYSFKNLFLVPDVGIDADELGVRVAAAMKGPKDQRARLALELVIAIHDSLPPR